MSLYSNSNIEYTISAECPWYEAQHLYGPPNVNWCEATVCQIINEPANTWSNLGFLIVAFIIYRRFNDPTLRTFAWIIALMGIFSGVYHASNNALTQYFDFIGMSLMTSFLLATIAVRFYKKNTSLYTYFWFFMAANGSVIMILNIVNKPIQALLLINAVPIAIAEIYLAFRDKRTGYYGPLFAATVILIAAQIAAQLDLKRIYCEPSYIWLHGHVIWHLLAALGMYFLALHIHRNTIKTEDL